jgi:hypothetical protein
MEHDKRTKIQAYFSQFPTWSVWSILLGIPLLAAYGFGLVLVGAGAWALYRYFQRPTDQEVDRWIEEDLASIHLKALNKTGLDVSELVSETVLVTGPRFWNIGGAEVGIKKGRDDIVRFMPIGVTVINFTQHQLVSYQCVMDLTTGNALSESTDEYFYSDVVSVSTQSKSLTWDASTLSKNTLASGPVSSLLTAGKLQLNAAETFVLTTSGGTSVEVVLKDPTIIKSAGGGSIPTERADRAVA